MVLSTPAKYISLSLYILSRHALYVVHAFTPQALPSHSSTTLIKLSAAAHEAGSKISAVPTSPVPPPPPISLPVWSFATIIPEDITISNTRIPTAGMRPSTSMNIVTFAVAVSVAAPKLWVVSLYHGTLTKDSFCCSKYGVLQLLRPEQKTLVPILGKQSGYNVGNAKEGECAAQGYKWTNRQALVPHFSKLELLPQCSSYVALELKGLVEAGDHVVALCEVVGTGMWDEPTGSVVPINSNGDAILYSFDQENALYSGLLRKEGII